MTSYPGYSIIHQPVFTSVAGRLFAVEQGQFDLFDLRRVFFIEGPAGSKRGEHAHRACTQWISVLSGTVRITIKDGIQDYVVSPTGFGELVVVNPGLWVELDFQEHGTVAVGADRIYEEHDYLRNWEEYLRFRGIG